jgi:predicted  nucleic acid-binding Zn-ribbon protein
MLELMVGGDEIGSALKAAEAGVKTAEQQITKEHADLDTQLAAAGKTLEEVLSARAALVATIPAGVVATYEQVARGRRGVAVAQARDGLCSECHVRLRPMVYQEVRHNTGLIQCDHCQRFLYFVPPQPSEASPAPA